MTFAASLTGDLDAFLNAAEFAKSLTVTSLDGAPVTIIGIFDAPFEAISALTGAVELTAPSVIVKTSATSSLRHGDWVGVDGVDYRIIGMQPDGTGLSRLVLSTDLDRTR